MKKGFSIIEAIASCVILAIVVVALINFFPVSSTMNAKADRLSEATLNAEDKIEEFRALGFQALEDTISAGYTTGTDTMGHIIREWNLTLLENIIEVDINCKWRTPGAPGHSDIRVITQISDHG